AEDAQAAFEDGLQYEPGRIPRALGLAGGLPDGRAELRETTQQACQGYRVGNAGSLGAEFLAAFGRGGDSIVVNFLNIVTHQDFERSFGGAAGAGDVFAERGDFGFVFGFRESGSADHGL